MTIGYDLADQAMRRAVDCHSEKVAAAIEALVKTYLAERPQGNSPLSDITIVQATDTGTLEIHAEIRSQTQAIIDAFLGKAAADFAEKLAEAKEQLKQDPDSAHLKKVVMGHQWTIYHTNTLKRYLNEEVRAAAGRF